MAPVSRYLKFILFAISFAVVDLPVPEGPSIAIITIFIYFHFKY